MIERQESTRSNCSSLKSSTSQLKKKIEELCLQKQPDEWQKEQEYDFRRNRRKLLEKQIKQELSKSRLKQARYLFIPAGLGIFCGTVMLFGSTIRSVGEGSVFWIHRSYFSIIGPSVLVIGLIFFFLAEGLQNHLTTKLRQRGIFELKQEIHPDFLITNKQRSRTVSAPDLDQNSENTKFLSTKGDSFLSSSLTSTSTLPDFAARWVRAMNLNTQNETLKHNGTSKLPERSVSFESDDSIDSGIMRSLVNAPQVEITDTDANTNVTVVHVNGGLNKPTSNIPNGKHKTLVRMEKIDLECTVGDCNSLLRNESAKSFQGFYLEGISEESSAELRIENV